MLKLKRFVAFLISFLIFGIELPVFSLEHNMLPSVDDSSFYKYSQQYRTKLPAGTPVVIKLKDSITSETLLEGINLPFEVAQDVKVGKKVLIKAGTRVNSKVLQVKKRRKYGEPGLIRIGDFSLNASDGTYIPLFSNILEVGADKTELAISIGLVVFWPLMLVKGKDAEIKAGAKQTVFTNLDVYINTEGSL